MGEPKAEVNFGRRGMMLFRFRRKPPSFEELHREGARALQRGELRKALKLLAKAVALEPTNVNARINYGSALYLARKFEEAETQFRAALEFEPENPYALLNLATIHHRKGQTERAVELLHQVLTFHPDHPDANYNLAVAYASLGEYERAREHAQRELEINPDHEKARRLLEQLEAFRREWE